MSNKLEFLQLVVNNAKELKDLGISNGDLTRVARKLFENIATEEGINVDKVIVDSPGTTIIEHANGGVSTSATNLSLEGQKKINFPKENNNENKAVSSNTETNTTTKTGTDKVESTKPKAEDEITKMRTIAAKAFEDKDYKKALGIYSALTAKIFQSSLDATAKKNDLAFINGRITICHKEMAELAKNEEKKDAGTTNAPSTPTSVSKEVTNADSASTTPDVKAEKTTEKEEVVVDAETNLSKAEDTDKPPFDVRAENRGEAINRTKELITELYREGYTGSNHKYAREKVNKFMHEIFPEGESEAIKDINDKQGRKARNGIIDSLWKEVEREQKALKLKGEVEKPTESAVDIIAEAKKVVNPPTPVETPKVEEKKEETIIKNEVVTTGVLAESPKESVPAATTLAKAETTKPTSGDSVEDMEIKLELANWDISQLSIEDLPTKDSIKKAISLIFANSTSEERMPSGRVFQACYAYIYSRKDTETDVLRKKAARIEGNQTKTLDYCKIFLDSILKDVIIVETSKKAA